MSEEYTKPLQLKVEAFKQRIAELTVAYEDKCADYRVQIHLLTENLQETLQANEELRTELASIQENDQGVKENPDDNSE